MKYVKNKAITILVLIAFILVTQSYAQLEQFQIFGEAGKAFQQNYQQGNILGFLGNIALAIFTLWFILKSKYGENWFKGSIATLLILVLGIYLVPRLSEISFTTMWYVAWVTFVWFSATAKTEPGEKSKHARLAETYFLFSIFVAPFNSLISPTYFPIRGDKLLDAVITHAAIAIFINFVPHALEKREEGRKKMKEEKKHQDELAAQQKREDERAEKEFERQTKLKQLELEAWEKRKEQFKSAQQIAINQPGNLAALSPFINRFGQLVPAQNMPFASHLTNNFSLENERQRSQRERKNRIRLLRYAKEEYAATKAGQEAAYLLKVMRELQQDIKSRRLENWVRYVGKNWDRCDFADNVKGFGNRGDQEWEKKLRDTVKHGPHKTIKVIKKRLRELKLQRDDAIQALTRTLTRVEELAPGIIEAYTQHDHELHDINELTKQHNKAVEALNTLYDTIRVTLQKAADEKTNENERRSLLVALPETVDKVKEKLRELQGYQTKLTELLKRNRSTIKELNKKKLNEIDLAWTADLLKQYYGINIPETMEEAA